MFKDIYTVFWRDWIVLKRRLTKFILSRMVAPILYLTAFGLGLGRSVNIDSGSYIDFLVPGIIALNSMNISFNSITPLHAERIYHKSLEEYIIAPISSIAFVIGKVSAAVLRSLISSTIIIMLAYVFGANLNISILFIFVLILNSIIFACVGFVAAMTLNTYEEMAQVNTYILLPMSFLCGTFFKTSTLPEAIRLLIECLPLTHTSYLLRGLSSNSDVSMLSLLFMIFCAILMFILSVHSFEKQTK